MVISVSQQIVKINIFIGASMTQIQLEFQIYLNILEHSNSISGDVWEKHINNKNIYFLIVKNGLYDLFDFEVQ